MIDEAYATGKYKSVVLMYNKFIFPCKANPPLTLIPVGTISDASEDLASSYTIEPSVEEVFKKPLLSDYIKGTN